LWTDGRFLEIRRIHFSMFWRDILLHHPLSNPPPLTSTVQLFLREC
jgi:hypothetical protein